MTYLLDTAPFLWALISPEKLSNRVRRLIEDRKSEILVSTASIWEIVIKSEKGLLPFSDPVAWLEQALETLAVSVVPIRPAHVYRLSGLPPIHRDPFDRILVAQALSEGWTLVCGDVTMHRYPAPVIW